MASVIAQVIGLALARYFTFATFVRETLSPSSGRTRKWGTMPEIEIIVATDGTVTLEAKGVVGASCLDLTKAIEQALGEVESRECKTEFYEQAEAGEQVSQQEV